MRERVERFLTKALCLMFSHDIVLEIQHLPGSDRYDNTVKCNKCGKVLNVFAYTALDVVLIDNIHGIRRFHHEIRKGLPWREKRQFDKILEKAKCQRI
jgi:hypothetical protein